MTDTATDAAADPFTDPIIDKELDIRGDICPITFVKAKLAIEKMAKGQVLQVLIDYAPSAVNVPRSLEHEGHEVLSVSEGAGPVWTLRVRKA
jgi:tRNA 2-thiouridine synthesizing protein A